MIYSHWTNEIVNKGEANNYIILEYPDLVQLIVVHPDGKRENDRILERNKAMTEIQNYPSAFDFAEIDVKNLIANDIKRSNKYHPSSGVSFSLGRLNNSGKIQYLTKIKVIIGAIKHSIISLTPIMKIILAIIIAGIGTLLGHILIEWYKSFYNTM